MAHAKSPSSRLQQIQNFLTPTPKTASTIPWDPESERFPTRKELPVIQGAPKGAAWFWGEDDNLGRLNLLTPSRVLAASKEIRTGELVSLNLPLNIPAQPAFGREAFKHEIKTLGENLAYDDVYYMNTQSGTQWDGFRHFAHVPSGSFYNGAKGSDIIGPNRNNKISIHHWSEHGITGRGVLLDYRGYAHRKGIQYDPYDYHPISFEDLYQCGKDQGIDIRPSASGGDMKIGDILLVRSGWVEAYHQKSPEERSALALRTHEFGKEDGQRYAGLSQEQEIVDWLHDCYFAAVGGDAPAFEAWPSQADFYLHEYILALWGMPLGEMVDLERLAMKCRERTRWTFFFSSVPANCLGGVGSHINGTAIL